MAETYAPTTRQSDWARSIVEDIKEKFRKSHDDLGIDPIRTRIDENWFYSLMIDKAIQDYRKDRSGFLRGLKDYLTTAKK
jgi:hypothetical protein